MTINAINIHAGGSLPNIARLDAGLDGKAPAASQGHFAALMRQYVDDTNTQQLDASRAAVELATGKNQNISDTMLALQKADVSFQMMLSVRNKLVEAYREVMRMQV